MADQSNTQQATPIESRRRSSVERYAGFTKFGKEAASHTDIHDQKAKSGVVGSLWNTYVKGHPTKPPTTQAQK